MNDRPEQPVRPDANGRYAEIRADHPSLPELSLIHDFDVISDKDGLRVQVHLLPLTFPLVVDRKSPTDVPLGSHISTCGDCGREIAGYRDYSLGLDGGMESTWLPCGHARTTP